MNFLAHLHLSYPSTSMMIGNYLADYLSNKDLDQLPIDICRGVLLHREIDTYSDNHPVMLRSKRRLYPTQGKYAAVLIDLFYDYFLARNWIVFHTESLDAFCEYVYKSFESYESELNGRAETLIERLLQYRWLSKYASYEGIEDSLQRLVKRSSFESNMSDGLKDLKRFDSQLNQDFMAFYPDMVAFASRKMAQLNLQN